MITRRLTALGRTTLFRMVKVCRIGFSRDKRSCRALLVERVAAAIEHRAALLRACPSTVLDVGANVGQFALAARTFLPDASVLSFEPLPPAADVFERIFKGDTKVRLKRVALGSERGVRACHVAAAEDSSSLLPITERQQALFPGTHEIGIVPVQVEQLADHVKERLGACVLLKIDVQGFELHVLEGAVDALEFIDWIYVECSFVELYQGQGLAGEVTGWLNTRGFDCVGIYNMVWNHENREQIQADFLFRHVRRAA